MSKVSDAVHAAFKPDVVVKWSEPQQHMIIKSASVLGKDTMRRKYGVALQLFVHPDRITSTLDWLGRQSLTIQYELPDNFKYADRIP